MVVGQDRELDAVGLGVQVGVLLGFSARHPVIESDRDVVPEILFAGTKYQAYDLQIVAHFADFWG